MTLKPTVKFNNFKKFLETISGYTVDDYTQENQISFHCNKEHTNTLGFGAFGNKKPKYGKTITFFCSTCESKKTGGF